MSSTGKRDWSSLLRFTKIFLAVTGTGLAAVLGYAADRYIKDSARIEAATATASLVTLPAKMQSLEEFKDRQEAAQRETANKLDDVVRVVTALKATTETNQTIQSMVNVRILDKLDRIDSRGRGP